MKLMTLRVRAVICRAPSRTHASVRTMIQGKILRKWCNLFGSQGEMQERFGGFMKCVGQCSARNVNYIGDSALEYASMCPCCQGSGGARNIGRTAGSASAMLTTDIAEGGSF